MGCAYTKMGGVVGVFWWNVAWVYGDSASCLWDLWCFVLGVMGCAEKRSYVLSFVGVSVGRSDRCFGLGVTSCGVVVLLACVMYLEIRGVGSLSPPCGAMGACSSLFSV